MNLTLGEFSDDVRKDTGVETETALHQCKLEMDEDPFSQTRVEKRTKATMPDIQIRSLSM